MGDAKSACRVWAKYHWGVNVLRIASSFLAVLLCTDAALGQAPEQQATRPSIQPPAGGRPSGALQQKLAPGLAAFTDDVLFGDVWRRPDLSPRDRSMVVISILIATGKTAQLSGHLNRALNNGVKPIEASEVLTHLAIYCGWPSAVSALEVYDQVYTARKVDTEALRATGEPLPLAPSDATRARTVQEQYGVFAPKFAQLTNEVVFANLWRRPDLSTRDRSLVTIAALAAMGDTGHLDLYLRRGLESGLTPEQIAEALTHLAFYAGWSKAETAISILSKAAVRVPGIGRSSPPR